MGSDYRVFIGIFIIVFFFYFPSFFYNYLKKLSSPKELCTAVLFLIFSFISSSRVSQASSIFEKQVSPPTGGIFIDFNITALVGLIL